MVFFYLLYIFSGVIKSFLIFYHITFPIDFTLLSAIFLVIAVFYNAYKRGFNTKIEQTFFYTLTCLLLFYLWMIITLIYTPSPHYSYLKTFYFLTNILAFVYPLIIGNFDYRKFTREFIVTVIFFSIFFLANYSAIIRAYRTGDANITGLYLVLGTLSGISVMILITAKGIVFYKKYIDFLLSFFLLVLIFLTAARGPLFFSLGLILIFLFLNLNKILSKKISRKIVNALLFSIIISFVVGIVFYFNYRKKIDPFVKRTIMRIEVMFTNPDTNKDNSSIKVRLDQLDFTVKTIFEDVESFMIGQGIGSFKLLYEGVDGRGYPHNIFLEIWFEMGLVGELLFLAFFFFLFYKKNKNDIVTIWTILFILLNMIKSNSIIDIRTYFAFFALFILDDNRIKKQNL